MVSRNTDPEQTLRLGELLTRWEDLHEQGQNISPEELCRDCPELLDALRQEIAALAPVPVPEDQGVLLPAVPGYDLLDELGRGGMGVVYKARQVKLGRVVALKLILAGPLATSGEQHRFRREAESVARLQHPHIVQIFEVGDCPAGTFFSMEFLAGTSLATRLHHAPLPVEEAASLIQVLARAMQHAHERGILHRDLKPANILFGSDGQPRVTDFGLAKQLDQQGQTLTGDILGTPRYMAPEQAKGQHRAFGPATDVWAMGAVLYECLTGRSPFQGADQYETLLQVINDDPVSPSRLRRNLPRDLGTICLKCLQRDPANRYPTAAELADDLARFQRGEPIRARAVGNAERAWRWCRRNKVVASLLASVALLLGLCTVGALLLALQQRQIALSAEKARDDAVTTAAEKAALADAAEKARRNAEDILERRYVHEASLLMDKQDFSGAAQWIGEALRLTRGDPAREEMHRYRLANVLRNRPRLVHLWFHEGPVHCLAFSSDGKRLASGSADDTARIWDVATCKPLTPPLEHAGRVFHLEWSKDDRRLLTVSDRFGGSDVRVWDTSSGKPISPRIGHEHGITHASFDPEGKRVVTAGSDGAAYVFHATTGALLCEPLKHKGPVRQALFSRDGRLIITTSDDQTACVWDAASAALVKGPLKHGRAIKHAAISPDGKLLAVGCAFQADVWNLTTGAPVGKTIAYPGNIIHVAFRPDGKWLTLCCHDNTVGIWNTATQKLIAILPGHRGPVQQASFSPGGKVLFTASLDRTARLWSMTTGALARPPMQHGGTVWQAVVSPDGIHAATACDDGGVRLWQPVTRVSLAELHKEARTRFARCGCFWYNRSRDADDTVVVSL